MGAGHHHHHHHHQDGGNGEFGHSPPPREDISRRLTWVLSITAVFMVAEIVGGVLSNSLALLADAGHMFTDVAALGLSVFAMRLAARPSTQRRTYGYARLEILAALLNGATLLLIAGMIIVEAVQRLREPVEIDGLVMLSVAGVGLVVNVIGASVLHQHSHDNLNVRGAYLHVLGDLLGSVGAIVAGVVIMVTGWAPADPLISIVIALLILFSAWHLVRDATDVLLESVPRHVDMTAVLDDPRGIEGLDDVHDLHVWTLTSGFVALSGHGVIDTPADHMRVLAEIREHMGEHGIGHVTFQLELRTLVQLEGAPS